MSSKPQLPTVDRLLYHDPPMVLLDRVVEIGDDYAKCEIDIGDKTMFMEAQGVPGFVGVEYMAQTIGAYAGYQMYKVGEPPPIGFLLGGPKIELKRDYFEKGTVVVATAKMIWGDQTMFQFECLLHDKATGELMGEARLNTFRPTDGMIPGL